MQFPKASSDLFMLAPSVNLKPVHPDAEALSLPAKSIMFSFDLYDSPVKLFTICNDIWMTACDLELCELASVACCVRVLFPAARSRSTSSTRDICTHFAPTKLTPAPDSRICTLAPGFSKSLTSSL